MSKNAGCFEVLAFAFLVIGLPEISVAQQVSRLQPTIAAVTVGRDRLERVRFLYGWGPSEMYAEENPIL